MDMYIKTGTVFLSPSGVAWTVIKTWSFPGVVWYKVRSEGGRIKNMLHNEFEGWVEQ